MPDRTTPRVFTRVPDNKSQEQENVIFMNILKRIGAQLLEERMRRLESYRTYYRRYPYDGKKMPIDMEVLQDTLPSTTASPEEIMIMNQARDTWLGSLTDKQKSVALDTEQGYKPRDIAKRQGKANSGSIRYLLHSARRKLEEQQDQE